MKKVVLFIMMLALVTSLAACKTPEVKELKDANVDRLYETVKVGGGDNYWSGEVKATDEKAGLVIDIVLNFKTDKVFTKGNMKAIQNMVEREIAGKYDEVKIRLKVTSEKPTDLIKYEYVNGTWTIK